MTGATGPITLTAREAQRLLALATYYKGPVDGVSSPALARAVAIVERNRGADWGAWPERRRMVAACQAVLDAMGHEPGPVDGRFGHSTREALLAALPDLAGAPAPDRDAPASTWPATPWRAAADYPRQGAMTGFYGPAGFPACTEGRVDLPFPFALAWSASERVASFRCHALLAAPLAALLAAAARHYGEARFRALRLDLFGGCYNFRRMRGGTSLSTHAWGAAVDLDPERNQLRWGRDRAALARPEYEPFWRIAEAHGATSMGRAKDFDWMHLQFARP